MQIREDLSPLITCIELQPKSTHSQCYYGSKKRLSTGQWVGGFTWTSQGVEKGEFSAGLDAIATLRGVNTRCDAK